MRFTGDPTRSPGPAPRAFEAVAERLREDLAVGRFPRGDRLPAERALAERFGVSRNTLREALRALENAGLIRLQKGATGGAFVTGTTGRPVASGLMDLYRFGVAPATEITEAHLWLAALVVREACARRSAETLAELAANVDATEAEARAGRPTAAVELDFHRILARTTGNPVVVVVVDGLLDVLGRFLERAQPRPDPALVPGRRRFLARFESGDADGAVEAMAESLRGLRALADAAKPVRADA
jgi:GntR family transcriptional repressor for pyruvate dehydrogenase complex